MISKEDFEEQKRSMRIYGRMPDTFIPYMHEYYRHKCMEKGIQEIEKKEQDFSEAIKAFFTIPVMNPQTNIATRENPQVAINRVVAHFDKLYSS